MIFIDKYIVAVYVPTPTDAVRELAELKDELTKVHGIGIIRAMKRGTPTLETKKGSFSSIQEHKLDGMPYLERSSQSCSTFRSNAIRIQLVEKRIILSFTDRFLSIFSKKRRSDIYE